MTDVADHVLVEVDIAQAPCEPAAIGVRVSKPAPHATVAKRVSKRLSKALTSRRNEVRGLVMHHGARRSRPTVLLLHLPEKARQDVAHKLCQVCHQEQPTPFFSLEEH